MAAEYPIILEASWGVEVAAGSLVVEHFYHPVLRRLEAAVAHPAEHSGRFLVAALAV